MIANFSFDDLIEATEAKVLQATSEEPEGYSISTDTRTITNGNVYLPLMGASFDGHKFIKEALDKGASGYFVDKNHTPEKIDSQNAFILEVEDTLLALMSLARYYRESFNAIVIALTGSSGKTTTKEILYSVLSEKFNVQRSKMNFNNEIGVSKTLLEVEEDTEIVILEMGMRGLNEIDLLVKCALPDISIVTNVGSSHIGRLGNIENIAKAKTEILNYLDPKSGLALLFADNKLLLEHSRKYKGKKILFGAQKDRYLTDCSQNKMLFKYKNEDYELPIPGDHNIINASVAIELAKYLGMSYEDIFNGLKNYKPLFGRWEEYKVFENSLIINDAYNSNPDSARAAVDTVFNIYPDMKKWIILGDMLELGDYEQDMHKDLGVWLNSKSPDALITVGKLSKLIANEQNASNTELYSFDNSIEAGKHLLKVAPKGTVILLKGSRGMGLEKILEELGVKNGGDNH